MRSQELEAWVLAIVDRVEAGHRVEDSRVELKADWPDARRAARRLAGHANAARGETVLWVVGLDEDRGVVPVQQSDFADWYQQVSQEFEGVTPRLQELIVPTQKGPVIALLVETLRAPYVVRNPLYGTQGGSIELEVPWRDGTSVRTARREDLIKMLVPMQTLPILEVLRANVSLSSPPPVERPYRNQVPPVRWAAHFLWEIRLSLYLTPRTNDRVVFPIHKAAFTYRSSADTTDVQFNDIRFSAASIFFGQGSRRDSHTVLTTSSEAIIDGPGILNVSGFFAEIPREVPLGKLTITLSMTPAGGDQPLAAVLTLVEAETRGADHKRWALFGTEPV
jgi:hypothetical protein